MCVCVDLFCVGKTSVVKYNVAINILKKCFRRT